MSTVDKEEEVGMDTGVELRMLPAPTRGEPEPPGPPPAGMRWWAWYGRVGKPVIERDEAGREIGRRWRTKRIGYVLG